uniref:Uncharacterized protein n=1 Tax=Nostoc flagelliforme str. Sunitezuoqi TaxID=676037 RepID=E7DPZ2_9NOSO|nr:hypothetical protein Nfla_5705 [Nostoc flagelliforme str. Sunitezuoqi]
MQNQGEVSQNLSARQILNDLTKDLCVHRSFLKGNNLLKVLLFKEDLGGSKICDISPTTLQITS